MRTVFSLLLFTVLAVSSLVASADPASRDLRCVIAGRPGGQELFHQTEIFRAVDSSGALALSQTFQLTQPSFYIPNSLVGVEFRVTRSEQNLNEISLSFAPLNHRTEISNQGSATVSESNPNQAIGVRFNEAGRPGRSSSYYVSCTLQ